MIIPDFEDYDLTTLWQTGSLGSGNTDATGGRNRSDALIDSLITVTEALSTMSQPRGEIDISPKSIDQLSLAIASKITEIKEINRAENDTDKYLNLTELCEKTGLKYSTISKKVGKLPYRKFSKDGRKYYRISDIEKATSKK